MVVILGFGMPATLPKVILAKKQPAGNMYSLKFRLGIMFFASVSIFFI